MGQPLQNISLHPATTVFHYATELFEGMKAYRTPKNEITFFRPQLNMDRMLRTSHKACLPDFDGDEFLKCISELVRVDQDWVPYSKNSSLYMRPTFIGTDPTLGVDRSGSALLYCILCPVGSYFATGTFEDRLIEMFGAGTACVVCPIKRILYMEESLYIPTPNESLALRLYKHLAAIQYGEIDHDWQYLAVKSEKQGLSM